MDELKQLAAKGSSPTTKGTTITFANFVDNRPGALKIPSSINTVQANTEIAEQTVWDRGTKLPASSPIVSPERKKFIRKPETNSETNVPATFIKAPRPVISIDTQLNSDSKSMDIDGDSTSIHKTLLKTQIAPAPTPLSITSSSSSATMSSSTVVPSSKPLESSKQIPSFTQISAESKADLGETKPKKKDRGTESASPRWSFEEDARLVALHANFQNNWKLYVDHIVGRTEKAIKQRWNNVIKKRIESHGMGKDKSATIAAILRSIHTKTAKPATDASLMTSKLSKMKDKTGSRGKYKMKGKGGDIVSAGNTNAKAAGRLLDTFSHSGKGSSKDAIVGLVTKQANMKAKRILEPKQIANTNWTDEEDIIVVELHKELGTKWQKMTRYLVGRTENAIKQRWNVHIRKKLTDEERETLNHDELITASRVKKIAELSALIAKNRRLGIRQKGKSKFGNRGSKPIKAKSKDSKSKKKRKLVQALSPNSTGLTTKSRASNLMWGQQDDDQVISMVSALNLQMGDGSKVRRKKSDKSSLSWSAEEDAEVIRLHRELQHKPRKWAEMANRIRGRTENAIKQRWNVYIKKRLPKWQIDEIARSGKEVPHKITPPNLYGHNPFPYQQPHPTLTQHNDFYPGGIYPYPTSVIPRPKSSPISSSKLPKKGGSITNQSSLKSGIPSMHCYAWVNNDETCTSYSILFMSNVTEQLVSLTIKSAPHPRNNPKPVVFALPENLIFVDDALVSRYLQANHSYFQVTPSGTLFIQERMTHRFGLQRDHPYSNKWILYPNDVTPSTLLLGINGEKPLDINRAPSSTSNPPFTVSGNGTSSPPNGHRGVRKNHSPVIPPHSPLKRARTSPFKEVPPLPSSSNASTFASPSTDSSTMENSTIRHHSANKNTRQQSAGGMSAGKPIYQMRTDVENQDERYSHLLHMPNADSLNHTEDLGVLQEYLMGPHVAFTLGDGTVRKHSAQNTKLANTTTAAAPLTSAVYDRSPRHPTGFTAISPNTNSRLSPVNRSPNYEHAVNLVHGMELEEDDTPFQFSSARKTTKSAQKFVQSPIPFL